LTNKRSIKISLNERKIIFFSFYTLAHLMRFIIGLYVAGSDEKKHNNKKPQKYLLIHEITPLKLS